LALALLSMLTHCCDVGEPISHALVATDRTNGSFRRDSVVRHVLAKVG
jgi:hypothetical protein